WHTSRPSLEGTAGSRSARRTPRRTVGVFFQAEDGIRDKLVTGVQTCALPISLAGGLLGARASPGPRAPRSPPVRALAPAAAGGRSEERRVGKECRSGWWAGPVDSNGHRGGGSEGPRRRKRASWQASSHRVGCW